MAAKPRARKLRELRAQALSVAPEYANGVIPEDVLVEVLDNATGMMRVAHDEAGKLTHDQMMVETHGGRMPHEWLRLSADTRQEVCWIASRMLNLEIDNRQAIAAEKMAEALAPIFRAVLEELDLTASQKRKAPAAVRGGLALLEGRPCGQTGTTVPS